VKLSPYIASASEPGEDSASPDRQTARSMSLKQLLYSDLARQYQLEGKVGIEPNLLRFLARLLHFRFLPNVICRTSRAAMLAGVPLLPKLLTYSNLVLFGLEVTPRCEIGPGVFFAHPVGCVIGAWKIGSNVTVFQGVGLGALRPDMVFERELRCEVGDNVVLGAGCKVLGPYHIGNNVTVGVNSVVMNSVPPGQTVFGIPARVVPSSAKQSDLALSEVGSLRAPD
jgi:serine O-acetyltransferase